MSEELLNLTIYTDYTIIKGLLKNKVNLLKDTNNNFFHQSNNASEQQKEDLVDIYLDIDRFLKQIDIKDYQKEVINAYINGYTGKDIEDIYGIPTTTSDRWLTTVSKQIAELNKRS